MSLSSKEHIKLLKSLTDHQVKFILIGGHAAIYYGVRRNTGDLDILIQPTEENGDRLIKALKNLDLELPEINPFEFEQKLVLSFGIEPDAVDILNYTPGIEFDAAYNNAHLIDFDGVQTRIIDLTDLIKNKESLNREGEKSLLDKYDIAVLKKIIEQTKKK